MKQLLFLALFLMSNLSYSQWIVEGREYADTILKSDNIVYVEYNTMGLDCGLPYNTNYSTYKFYKRSDRSDLIYYEALYSKDSSRTIGFYRKVNQVYSDMTIECWVADYFLIHIDKEGNIIRQVFLNQGEEVKPIPYSRIPK